MESITGIVQNKKEKSLAINGEWFNSFLAKTIEDINKDDEVKISYTIKDQFKNIKSIEKLNKENKEVKPNFNQNSVATMLLSYSKDLAIALMENGKPQELHTIVKSLVDEYNYIIKNI
jgi:hypothetical protein